jgi:hypothetical protein
MDAARARHGGDGSGHSQRHRRLAAPARAVLQREDVTLLVSVPLLIEYEAVMTRPEHLMAAGLTVPEVGALLDAVAAVTEPVRLAFLWRPLLPDFDDDMVVGDGSEWPGHWIVTFNRRDFALTERLFGIAVLSPSEALKRLEEGK